MTRSPDLTAAMREVLRLVAAFRPLTTSQIQRLLDWSYKTAQRTVVKLEQAELIETIRIPQSLQYSHKGGLTEKVCFLSRPGARVLGVPVPSVVVPKRTDKLFHHILAREVVCWTHQCARTYDLETPTTRVRGLKWRDLIPDAFLALPIGDRTMVALVEADTGQERGEDHWDKKVAGYAQIFASESVLESAIGFKRARILVVAPTLTRIRWLERFIQKNDPEGFWLYWFTTPDTLETPDLARLVWRNEEEKRPLIDVRLLSTPCPHVG